LLIVGCGDTSAALRNNQRGPLLATTIRASTDAIVATLPIRLD